MNARILQSRSTADLTPKRWRQDHTIRSWASPFEEFLCAPAALRGNNTIESGPTPRCLKDAPCRPSIRFLFIGSRFYPSLPPPDQLPFPSWLQMVVSFILLCSGIPTGDFNPVNFTPMLSTHQPCVATGDSVRERNQPLPRRCHHSTLGRRNETCRKMALVVTLRIVHPGTAHSMVGSDCLHARCVVVDGHFRKSWAYS